MGQSPQASEIKAKEEKPKRERQPPPEPVHIPDEPPDEAEELPDGTFSLELPDESTVRWTKRPDGTRRKPERTRKGFVGDLEEKKYVPPFIRNGDVDFTGFQ